MWAASKGDLQMVQMLVQLGAEILKPKKDGFTLLHIAASQNDIHVLDYAISVKKTKSIDIPNEEVSDNLK